MPLALVIRLLVRLVAGLFFWRLASNRRRAFAGGQAAPGAAPKPHQIDAQAAMTAVRTSVSLSWRALLAVTCAAAAATLAAAGVTIAVLTPRWLGALLLVAAIVVGAAAWYEGRLLFVALRARSRLRRAERLRKTATS